MTGGTIKKGLPVGSERFITDIEKHLVQATGYGKDRSACCATIRFKSRVRYTKRAIIMVLSHPA